ncbi:MAG: type II 3-dehydroquinate dehydratase [Fidelibacterota bacterium]
MKILVLEGPNLNLLGIMSSRTGGRLTLDKVHRQLRRKSRKTNCELKIFQTHKVFQALNILQRNRNWANGLLFAPMAWAHYEYSIQEALSLISVPTVQLLFPPEYSSVNRPEDSIFTPLCTQTLVGVPDNLFIQGLDILTALD